MTYGIAQGTLLNIKWQPGWEGSLGENGYMHVHGWGPLLFTWNYNNILNQLCAVLCLVAQSCPSLCDHMDYSPAGSSAHGDSPCKNTGVGSLSLLQGNFPIQELNGSLQGSPLISYTPIQNKKLFFFFFREGWFLRWKSFLVYVMGWIMLPLQIQMFSY